MKTAAVSGRAAMWRLMAGLLAGLAAWPAAGEDAPATFLGTPDDEILKRLCQQEVVKLDLNHQGTTVKFKATFTDGTRGSLRPAQKSEAGNHRADVAAYRLSRALGLGKVAPACMRTMTREQIFGANGAAATRARLERDLEWSADGKSIEASVVVWVDKVRSADLDRDLGTWRAALAQSRSIEGESAELLARAAEGSRLLAFDFLIDNWDRWSGSNTFRVGKDGPFVWLDNAAGFGHYAGVAVRRNEKQLDGVERFSRGFIAALRGVDDTRLAAALSPAGLRPVSLRHVSLRRAALLHRVDALIARHGEAKVLCFD